MWYERSVARDTVTTTVVTLISRFGGFIVSMVVAAVFGATHETDAYYLAVSIPLLVTGALTVAFDSVFVPVFVKLRTAEPRTVPRVLGSALGYTTLISLCLMGMLAILIPSLLPYLARGFSPETVELSQKLAWELLPTILTTSICGLLYGVFNSYGKFLVPASTPLIQYAAVLVAMVIGRESLGIECLPVGLVGGGCLQILLLLVLLRTRGIRLRPGLTADPALRRMGVLAIPMCLGTGALYVNILVDRLMASWLGEGSVTALEYAARINAIPVILLNSGFLTVLLARWSHAMAHNQPERVRASISSALGVAVMVLAPVTLLFFVFSDSMVALLYGRGAFGARAVRLTGYALKHYAIGLIPVVAGMILVRGFLVTQDTLTLLWLALANNVLNIGFNLILMRYLAVGGIALSTTVVAVIVSALLLFLLSRKEDLGGGAIVGRSGRLEYLKAAAGCAAVGLLWLGAGRIAPKEAGPIATLLGAGAILVLVYPLSLWLLRSRYLGIARDALFLTRSDRIAKGVEGE